MDLPGTFPHSSPVRRYAPDVFPQTYGAKIPV